LYPRDRRYHLSTLDQCNVQSQSIEGSSGKSHRSPLIVSNKANAGQAGVEDQSRWKWYHGRVKRIDPSMYSIRMPTPIITIFGKNSAQQVSPDSSHAIVVWMFLICRA
jgi:hypothetical protein